MPGSPAAGYCVIRNGNQHSQELLEKTLSEIIRSTEALAEQELALYQRHSMSRDRLAHQRVYIPVLVTSAKLFVCDADYGKVDLTSGDVPEASSRPVPWLRFNKTLTADVPGRSNATNIEEFAKSAERTVWVVEAAHLGELLDKWQFSKSVFGAASLMDLLYGTA